MLSLRLDASLTYLTAPLLGLVDTAVTISDAASFEMASRLVKEEGLLVGPSSGTAVAAAVEYVRQGRAAGPVVALLTDSWDRYWSKTLSPTFVAGLAGD